MLINKGEIFHEPLLHKDIHELIGHVLGEQYLLSCYTANIAKPGGVAMNCTPTSGGCRHRPGVTVPHSLLDQLRENVEMSMTPVHRR